MAEEILTYHVIPSILGIEYFCILLVLDDGAVVSKFEHDLRTYTSHWRYSNITHAEFADLLTKEQCMNKDHESRCLNGTQLHDGKVLFVGSFVGVVYRPSTHKGIEGIILQMSSTFQSPVLRSQRHGHNEDGHTQFLVEFRRISSAKAIISHWSKGALFRDKVSG